MGEELTGPVAMRLLHTAGNGRRLARGLGGKLLARGFSARRLTSSLFSTCHEDDIRNARWKRI